MRPISPAGDAREPLRLIRSKTQIPHLRWLPRERLDRRFDDVFRFRLTLVVAPAGSGKTTLLAEWATAAGDRGVPVAWFRAESTDGEEATILAYLHQALGEALGQVGDGAGDGAVAGRIRTGEAREGSTTAAPWRSAEDAAAALEEWGAGRVLLVVDDLHALAGTLAEAVLERLLDVGPPGLAIVAGTRTPPGFDLSRRQVSGEVQVVGGDDLRFRLWEVEHLFRDFYGDSIRPDELGRLARRTEGWAAGLQLFHLATRDKPSAERTRLLDGLTHGTRLTREYLARNVLDELPEELRRFLVDTCVLRRLSGPLCDRFLERAGSARVLEELERRQIFTVALDDEGTYRYHEVLRSHLEGVLVDERGEAGARAWAARAGELLEEEGAVAEAVAAYCRAEAWDAAVRVLGSGGGQLAEGAQSWLDAVPMAALRNDPWLMLATARRFRSEGHWWRAVQSFAAAEAAFGAAPAGNVCRAERLAILTFLEPEPRPGTAWPDRIRGATHRDPLRYRVAPAGDAGASEAGALLAAGVAALLAGRVTEAAEGLRAVPEAADATAAQGAAATIGAGVAILAAGDPQGAAELERGVHLAERAGQLWLARLGRSVLIVAESPVEGAAVPDLRTLRTAAASDGDQWGATLAALAEGFASLANPEPALAALEVAVAGARRLGATTIEAWARALASLAAAWLGLDDARETALQAESLARTANVPGARLAAHLALARTDPAHRADHLALAETASRDTGLRPRGRAWQIPGAGVQLADRLDAEQADRAAPASGPSAQSPLVRIRLLGGFAIEIDGRPVDLGGLKPRPRAILRHLALDAGRPVHREVLAAAFWPEADAEAAARNLHVALSGVRRELAPGDGAVDSLLVREGDAYRLAIPPGSSVDLLEVEAAMLASRQARLSGRRREAIDCGRHALDLATGELLPEDGPADWVVARRDALVAALTETARCVAELLLEEDPDGAAEACVAGLRFDPHHDRLWRLLIEARERAGDQAAATSARQGYVRMLDRLGINTDDVATARPSAADA